MGGIKANQAVGLRALAEDGTQRLQRAAASAAVAGGGSPAVEAADAEGEQAAHAAEGPLGGTCAMLRGVTQWDLYLRGKTGGDGSAPGESLRYAPPFSEMARATVTLTPARGVPPP